MRPKSNAPTVSTMSTGVISASSTAAWPNSCRRPRRRARVSGDRSPDSVRIPSVRELGCLDRCAWKRAEVVVHGDGAAVGQDNLAGDENAVVDRPGGDASEEDLPGF